MVKFTLETTIYECCKHPTTIKILAETLSTVIDKKLDLQFKDLNIANAELKRIIWTLTTNLNTKTIIDVIDKNTLIVTIMFTFNIAIEGKIKITLEYEEANRFANLEFDDTKIKIKEIDKFDLDLVPVTHDFSTIAEQDKGKIIDTWVIGRQKKAKEIQNALDKKVISPNDLLCGWYKMWMEYYRLVCNNNKLYYNK